jgi:hypothetical protein
VVWSVALAWSAALSASATTRTCGYPAGPEAFDGIPKAATFSGALGAFMQGSWAASLASSVAGKMGAGQSGKPVGL